MKVTLEMNPLDPRQPATIAQLLTLTDSVIAAFGEVLAIALKELPQEQAQAFLGAIEERSNAVDLETPETGDLMRSIRDVAVDALNVG